MDDRLQNLIRIINSGNLEEREEALQILRKIDDSNVIELLLELFNNGNEELRSSIVSYLAEFKDIRITEALLNALNDKHSSVRTEVVYVLGKLGDVQAVKPLIKLLSSKEENVNIRWLAADALGRIGNQKAIKALFEALQDDNADIREEAVRILGYICTDEEVLPTLERLEREDDAETSVLDNTINKKIRVKDTAAEALRAIKQRLQATS